MPFPSCRHHAVFVSAQLVPTLLAAALPGQEPACVHAIVTPKMRGYAATLKDALTAQGRQYREYPLTDSSQQGIYDVLDAIREACDGQSLGLNLTGGTKLMTLAAAEWAYACDVPAFYMDTGEDVIVLPGRTWEYLPMPSVLDVSGLLAAGGYTVRDCSRDAVPGERRDILHAMLRLLCTAPRAAQALQSLNAAAAQAGKRRDMLVEDTATPSPAWQELLDLCRQADMLQHDKGYICFPSEDARRWCNGLWFEEFVRMTLYKMQADKRISDWAASVNVSRNGVKNELDALFCVRNRLFVIECKTAAMTIEPQAGDHNKVASILYKADSLHDRLGGIYARSALCSVLPLERKERERAQALGIHVVCGGDLLKLDENLVRWASLA